jgi:hypothetical protein
MLLKTINAKAVVTATASGKPVLKNIALQNPVMLRITDKQAAIFTSLVKNCPRDFLLSVPSASPRITEYDAIVNHYSLATRTEQGRERNLKQSPHTSNTGLISRITTCTNQHRKEIYDNWMLC